MSNSTDVESLGVVWFVMQKCYHTLHRSTLSIIRTYIHPLIVTHTSSLAFVDTRTHIVCKREMHLKSYNYVWLCLCVSLYHTYTTHTHTTRLSLSTSLCTGVAKCVRRRLYFKSRKFVNKILIIGR